MSVAVPPLLYMLSWHAQGRLHLCVICFVYFTRVHCVRLWDLESCLVLVWIRGKWLCRQAGGCGVAVGEHAVCELGRVKATLSDSLQLGKRRLSERAIEGWRHCLLTGDQDVSASETVSGRRRCVTSMDTPREASMLCSVNGMYRLVTSFLFTKCGRERVLMFCGYSWSFPVTFPVTFKP